MDKAELDAVRATIVAEYTSQIEKLKEQMSSELNALTRLEARFKGVTPKQTQHMFMIRKASEPEQSPSPKTPNAKKRILDARSVVTGKFSRKDLHAAVNHDGNSEMREGTFSPYVSELIRNQEIIQIEKAVGTKPAVYMWAEEFEKMKAGSSAKADLDLF